MIAQAALSKPGLKDWVTRLMHSAALAVFFLVPWWLRLAWGRDNDPYFVRFLITIPWAATVILWIVHCFLGWTAWRRVWPWLAPWLLLTLWIALSQRWAPYADPSWDAASQAIAVSAFAIAMATAGPSPIQATAALGAGLVFQGILAILQTALQAPVGLQLLGEFEIRPGRVGLNVLTVNGVSWLRPYGLSAHPNMLGGFFAVALLAVFTVLVLSKTARRWRWIAGAAAGVGWWALLLTFSRSAWLGVAIGAAALIGVWGWRTRPAIAWPRLHWALLVGGALTLIFAATHSDLVFARTGIGDESNELRSVSDRLVFIEYAATMIRDHPISGVGIGMNAWVAAQMLYDDPRQFAMQAQSVHNIPLLIWSELGLIGLILWAASIIGAAWILLRSARPDPMALAFAAGFLALLVVGLLDFYTWGIFQFGLLWWGALGVALHEKG